MVQMVNHSKWAIIVIWYGHGYLPVGDGGAHGMVMTIPTGGGSLIVCALDIDSLVETSNSL